ncbi:hypothetical protein ACOMCU_01560 [Lysinibacillus sp. UGB7]|uniref:hypothetical protein n=1 Tax=Lysinibacillus sp. UGB7 TaxID=3411039 RepID=UPI003B7A6849
MGELAVLEQLSTKKCGSYKEARKIVQSRSNESLSEYIIEYITNNDFGYELMCIVEQRQLKVPVLYRGTKYLKSELTEGTVLNFNEKLISTSKDMLIAETFALSATTDEVAEWVYDLYEDVEDAFPTVREFCKYVNDLYTNVLFVIKGASVLVLGDFYAYNHNFTEEQEVLIEGVKQSFVVKKVTFKEGVKNYSGKIVKYCEVEISKVKIA